MKQYIVDDRTGEINQIGPFEAEDIHNAFAIIVTGEFKNFRNNIDIEVVDETHGWIVINLPGGARYEYEVGEVETEPETGAEQPEDEDEDEEV